MSLAHSILIAQLTDTHLFGDRTQTLKGCNTYDSLQAVVHQLQRHRPQPDLLLLTGDLSQDDTIDSYQQVRSLLQPLHVPTYWLPGNHDQYLDLPTQVLQHPPFSSQNVIDMGGWRLILLNSMQHQQVNGAIAPEQLNWLEQQLQSIQPTLIALHHPPVAIGSVWMDRMGLQNPDPFLAVVDRYSHIKLVVFGHIHQAFDQWRHSVRYLGTPSTCIQFVPHSADMILSTDPPGFRLIYLYPDGQHHTEVQGLATTVTRTD